MTIQYFNGYYFLYIFVAVAIFLVLYFALRHASKKVIFWALFELLAANFVLHFLKLAFPPYCDGLPKMLHTISCENVCAVSTLVFPFFYLSKRDALRDYMFYMGFISGTLTCFVPIGALGGAAFSFETMRFYFCHIMIAVVPLLMVLLHEHKLDYHRVMRVPAMLLLVECVILVNEVILMSVGFIDGGLNELLSPSYRNSALIFGITPQLEGIAGALLIFVPEFLRVNPITGDPMFWPIVWMIIPMFIYVPLGAFLLSLPWEFKHVKYDVILLKDKLKDAFKKKTE